ncbi:Regulatory protein RecX [Bienertia sinuspersici]
MSIFSAANFITKLSITLQPRHFCLPWLKNSGFRCFSHKENGPALPVRYIPKKSKENENGFTDIEYLEALADVEEAQIQRGIHYGKPKRSKTSGTKQGAGKLAIELLAKRAYTVVELRKKLTAKNFPVDVVEAVVSDFQDRGLINDSLYAETFSHSRWKSSTWGPRRIKQALLNKGVCEGDVEKALKWVFEDGEDHDQKSNMRLSNSSLQQLYEQASKQWQRSQNVAHETRKTRLIRWLQYRGFDWSVVSFILKRLETENPP